MLASQIANVGESVIGAVLQDKEGFKWVSQRSIFMSTFLIILFFCYESNHGFACVAQQRCSQCDQYISWQHTRHLDPAICTPKLTCINPRIYTEVCKLIEYKA